MLSLHDLHVPLNAGTSQGLLTGGTKHLAVFQFGYRKHSAQGIGTQFNNSPRHAENSCEAFQYTQIT